MCQYAYRRLRQRRVQRALTRASSRALTFCGTMIGWIDRESLYSTETERSDRRIGSAPPSEFSSQFGMKLEALWGKDGVLCIERPRWLALAGNDPWPVLDPALRIPGQCRSRAVLTIRQSLNASALGPCSMVAVAQPGEGE